MSATDPTCFGRYIVQERLGNPGAYAITFLVVNEKNEQFALKWLKDTAPVEGPFRFENEAWALEKLKHASVPQFFDKGLYADRPYIVMGYARGQTLRSIIETNRRENGTLSQLKVLLIGENLLDVLSYVHANGIVHRDVKDDNALVSPSGNELSLIDFGVCKGGGAPAEGHTFWHAGASRFSPPEKLRHPTSAEPKHDVFAVGVLCYLLLTNHYPWEVHQGQDSGHLERLMRSDPPVPTRERNRSVDRAVSELVQELLKIEDRHRPSAEEARKKFQDLRLKTETNAAPSVVTRTGAIRYRRVVRDPLHGDIPMTDFEFDVINTREFQHLRQTRQLGFANLVYPGAEHSRFSHALGTMHVADKILSRIEKTSGTTFDNDERLLARCFALVHDIAHMPFGHTLEDELGIFARHDANNHRLARLLTNGRSEIGPALQRSEYGRITLDLLQEAGAATRHTWINELVASSVGADVLDYIDRDAYFCGLDHRVDSAIFRRYSIDTASDLPNSERHLIPKLYGRHGFRLDADFAILSLLRERFALFMKVYTHSTKIAAGAMLGKAIFEAKKANPETFSEDIIERMGDDELLYALQSTASALCSDLSIGIINRRLYKPVYRAQILSSKERTWNQYEQRQRSFMTRELFSPRGRDAIEARYADQAKTEHGNVIFYATRSAPGAQRVQQHFEVEQGGREFRDEVYTPYQEMFGQHLSLWNVYVLAHPNLEMQTKRLIADIVSADLHLPNQIEIGRKQLGFRF